MRSPLGATSRAGLCTMCGPHRGATTSRLPHGRGGSPVLLARRVSCRSPYVLVRVGEGAAVWHLNLRVDVADRLTVTVSYIF
jgi:hypothetical protein